MCKTDNPDNNPKLKIIAIEGIENVGKTTLIDYIMKNTQYNIKMIKFPSKRISKLMTDKIIQYGEFIRTLNELIKTSNKYRERIRNNDIDGIDFNNIKTLNSTIEYFLIKIISYNNDLVRMNLLDQINHFGIFRKDNTEDSILICDRAVISTYYMNFCEAIYFEYIKDTFFNENDNIKHIDASEYYNYAKTTAWKRFLFTMKLDDYEYYKDIDSMISIILTTNKHEFTNHSSVIEYRKYYYQKFYDEYDDLKKRSVDVLSSITDVFTTYDHNVKKIDIYNNSGNRKSCKVLYKEIQEEVKKHNFII